MYSRPAISLVTSIPYDTEFKEWKDVEKIFLGILSFLKLDGSESLCIRMYKVKYELCNRKLKLKGGVATGRISLEYKSIEDAYSHKNMYVKNLSFRFVQY